MFVITVPDIGTIIITNQSPSIIIIVIITGAFTADIVERRNTHLANCITVGNRTTIIFACQPSSIGITGILAVAAAAHIVGHLDGHVALSVTLCKSATNIFSDQTTSIEATIVITFKIFQSVFNGNIDIASCITAGNCPFIISADQSADIEYAAIAARALTHQRVGHLNRHTAFRITIRNSSSIIVANKSANRTFTCHRRFGITASNIATIIGANQTAGVVISVHTAFNFTPFAVNTAFSDGAAIIVTNQASSIAPATHREIKALSFDVDNTNATASDIATIIMPNQTTCIRIACHSRQYIISQGLNNYSAVDDTKSTVLYQATSIIPNQTSCIGVTRHDTCRKTVFKSAGIIPCQSTNGITARYIDGCQTYIANNAA